MSDKHGMVWWTELMTGDVEAAKAYYTQVCGWQFETVPMDGFDYHIGMREGVPLIGIAALEGEADPYWLSYFAVDDLDAALDATRAAGGTVTREPFVIPGTGRIALLTDPTGAALGLMTPEDMPQG